MARIIDIGGFDRQLGQLGKTVTDRAAKSTSGTTNPGVIEAPHYLAGGQVQIVQGQGDNEVRVTLWLAGPVRPTGSGFGGWTVNGRDGRKGSVDFDGVDPERYTVPILVNGWADEIDQQETWETLWRMAAMRGDQPPDTVWVFGNVPPAVQEHAWLIETITPADPPGGVLQSYDNKLWREAANITILEPEFADLVTKPIKRAQRKAKSNRKPRTTTTRKIADADHPKGRGESLMMVAARIYGNPARWRDIAAANPKLPGYGDPEAIPAGTTLKLPD